MKMKKPRRRSTTFQETLAVMNETERKIMNEVLRGFATKLHKGLSRDGLSPGIEMCMDGIEDLWADGYLKFCWDEASGGMWLELWDEHQGKYVKCK